MAVGEVAEALVLLVIEAVALLLVGGVEAAEDGVPIGLRRVLLEAARRPELEDLGAGDGQPVVDVGDDLLGGSVERKGF